MAADLAVKRDESERRDAQTTRSASVEDKQRYAGNATMARSDFIDTQADLDQAEVNLKRAEVR